MPTHHVAHTVAYMTPWRRIHFGSHGH